MLRRGGRGSRHHRDLRHVRQWPLWFTRCESVRPKGCAVFSVHVVPGIVKVIRLGFLHRVDLRQQGLENRAE